MNPEKVINLDNLKVYDKEIKKLINDSNEKKIEALPIGTILPYTSTKIPTGWIACQGQAVSRTTYAKLFEVIGTTFGQGDGSTTFNLPNLSGRTFVSYSLGDADFGVIGNTGGEKSVKLKVSEMPSHTHKTGIQTNISGSYNSGSNSAYVYFDQASGANTTSTGGDQAHNNLQPYFVGVYIIKVEQIVSSIDEGLVTSTRSDSTTDTYSCEYINNNTPTVLSGEQEPSSNIGKNGDIYIKIES